VSAKSPSPTSGFAFDAEGNGGKRLKGKGKSTELGDCLADRGYSEEEKEGRGTTTGEVGFEGKRTPSKSSVGEKLGEKKFHLAGNIAKTHFCQLLGTI